MLIVSAEIVVASPPVWSKLNRVLEELGGLIEFAYAKVLYPEIVGEIKGRIVELIIMRVESKTVMPVEDASETTNT